MPQTTTFCDPMTGQVVHGDFNEHMRVAMLAPCSGLISKRSGPRGVTDDHIGQSLAKFAAQRGDVFDVDSGPTDDAWEELSLEEQIAMIRGGRNYRPNVALQKPSESRYKKALPDGPPATSDVAFLSRREGADAGARAWYHRVYEAATGGNHSRT